MGWEHVDSKHVFTSTLIVRGPRKSPYCVCCMCLSFDAVNHRVGVVIGVVVAAIGVNRNPVTKHVQMSKYTTSFRQP